MLLIVAALLAVWLIVALAAVLLCSSAGRLDDEIAEADRAPVIEIRPAA